MAGLVVLGSLLCYAVLAVVVIVGLTIENWFGPCVDCGLGPEQVRAAW